MSQKLSIGLEDRILGTSALACKTLVTQPTIDFLILAFRIATLFPGHRSTELGRVHGVVRIRRAPLRLEVRPVDRGGLDQEGQGPLLPPPVPRLLPLLRGVRLRRICPSNSRNG